MSLGAMATDEANYERAEYQRELRDERRQNYIDYWWEGDQAEANLEEAVTVAIENLDDHTLLVGLIKTGDFERLGRTLGPHIEDEMNKRAEEEAKQILT